MQKVLLRFPQHHAHITVTEDGTVHVFKYNEKTCDMYSFPYGQSEDASDWAMEPLPTIYYQVNLPE
jgi:hypothetical protein